ncbi:hypothetical protein BG006_000280 [Podila minutissima]|uniref:Uncharacterized protein n=1 Tax=Podila minutissima TaxID=64525 RepID=A0A9P5SBG9_9FUNG|nr:hypothetical protein BG006_000280 [Podila minutissima]
MTSTAGQWSSLFHNLPARTPASQLYTEESISNEELTADQLIDKAQTNASLLAEIIAASTDVILNLHDFENSEIIQTLHRECQGISDYLFERIWHDSGNDDSHYYAYDSSSRHETQQKTHEEEAQIAAFIACNEQIQAAFRGYDELRDFLQAKQMQADENARAHVSTLDNDLDSDYDHDSDDDNYDAAPGTSTDHRQLLTDHDDDDTLSRNHQHQHHLRKSEQPLVWKLDPREDFKANKMKMKKKMDQAERERLDRERMQERKEALHIPNEVAIPPEVLIVDHPVQPVEERELEEQEFRRMKEEEINKALTPEDGAEVARLNPVAQVEEEEEEDEEDVGALSDDSWEEIPGPSVVGLSIGDSGSSSSSSSSSSFLITSDASPSRTPN